MTSLMVAASTSTVSAPDVNLLSGVGMTTLSDMISTSQYLFECGKFRLDHLRRCEIQSIQCLQAVAGDSQNRQIRFLDSALRDQFLSHGDGDSAGGFGENAFSFG